MGYSETPMKGTIMFKTLNSTTVKKLVVIAATTVAVQIAADLIVKQLEKKDN